MELAVETHLGLGAWDLTPAQILAYHAMHLRTRKRQQLRDFVATSYAHPAETEERAAAVNEWITKPV